MDSPSVVVIPTEELEVPSRGVLSSQRTGPKEAEEWRNSAMRSLDELKELLGSILVPSFMPEGYTLARSLISPDGRTCDQQYLDPSRGRALVDIMQTIASAKLKVPPSHFKETTVGTTQGYLVDGTWVAQVDGVRAGDPLPLKWVPGNSRCLYFTQQDWTICIASFGLGYPEGLVSGAELVEIGASLQPY